MQTRVLFIADRLAADARSAGSAHPGGAELTDLAAIEACPHRLEVQRVRDVAAHEVDGFDVIVVALRELASVRRYPAVAHRWLSQPVIARALATRTAAPWPCP